MTAAPPSQHRFEPPAQPLVVATQDPMPLGERIHALHQQVRRAAALDEMVRAGQLDADCGQALRDNRADVGAILRRFEGTGTGH